MYVCMYVYTCMFVCMYVLVCMYVRILYMLVGRWSLHFDKLATVQCISTLRRHIRHIPAGNTNMEKNFQN